MKIALTGSGGTGKTVTAMEISRLLGVPHVRSQARVVFEEMRVTSMENNPSMDPETFLECQRRILELQIRTEKEACDRSPLGWVAERTVLDTAAYCAWWASSMPLTGGAWRDKHEKIKQECLRVVNTAMLHASSRPYDAVFVMPYGNVPLGGDLHRSGDAMYQRSIDLMIGGLTLRNLAEVTTVVPKLLGNETAVAMWILKRCGLNPRVGGPEGVVDASERILAERIGACPACFLLGHQTKAKQVKADQWACDRCGSPVVDPTA